MKKEICLRPDMSYAGMEYANMSCPDENQDTSNDLPVYAESSYEIKTDAGSEIENDIADNHRGVSRFGATKADIQKENGRDETFITTALALGATLLYPVVGFLSMTGCYGGDDGTDGFGENANESAECGNRIREEGEQCDGSDIGTLNCDAFQEGAQGELRCTDECLIDASGCEFEFPPNPSNQEDCEEGNYCDRGGNIVGRLDWLDTTTLPAGPIRQNSLATGMILFSMDGEEGYRCSATIIGSELIVTNHHCAPDNTVAQSVRFFPTTESNVSVDQQFLDSFACNALVATECAHDVSILRCQPNPISGLLPGNAYEIANIELARDFMTRDQVYLLHTNCDHRNGNDNCTPIKLFSPGIINLYGYECVTFEEDENACSNCRSDALQAQHSCDTLTGSSGGGMFDAVTNKLKGINWGSRGDEDSVTNLWNLATSFTDLVQTNPAMAAVLAPLAECIDNDGDGYGAAVGRNCLRPGIDCNDGEPSIHPGATEVCDRIDNDCNGQVDHITRSCGSDVGECETGTQTCENGVWGDNCEGEVRPSVEVCDVLDNDCDGRIDNGVIRNCGSDVGECQSGEQICFFGDWEECIGDIEPEPETCDGLDNNCNGEVDEGVNPLMEATARCLDDGICAFGGTENICIEGAWRCIYPEDYVEDECEIVDSSCGFGALDDPLCNDGLDNDCDGIVDENSQYEACVAHPDFWRVASGLECYTSLNGECGRHGGTYECVQLAESCGVGVDCVGATFPRWEQCDGRDWDCDGQIDNRNDLDRDGFGDCVGRMDCNETRADINPAGTEVCDGLDNDCDGSIDEGSLCDDGNSCTQDSCNGGAGCNSTQFCWEDMTTGAHLMWQIDPPDERFGFSQALDYCAGLTLGGYDDWRAPSISELRSLVRGCASTALGGECRVTDSCLDVISCFVPGYCTLISCGGLFAGPDEDGCFWDVTLDGCSSDALSNVFWSTSAAVRNSIVVGQWAINFTHAPIIKPPVTADDDDKYKERIRCVR